MQVAFPLSEEQKLKLRGSDIDGDDPSAEEGLNSSAQDSRFLAQFLKRKSPADGSDAPLTTNAVRQLEKAKKEVVYNECVVRIRYNPIKSKSLIIEAFFL